MITQRGFTIIELIITVALLAAMVVIAVPAFTSSTNNNEMAAKSNTFLSAIKVARSEATKRRQNVVLCASNDQASCTSCTTNCGRSDWSGGWIVFEDTNNNSNIDAGESIITSYRLTTAGFSITRYGINRVSFSPTGLATSDSYKEFEICKAGTKEGRRFIVARSGIVSAVDLQCP